jgi:hypothetical protein
MGLGLKVIHLALELYKNNYIKDLESVIDMGDQDVHADYNLLSKELNFLNKNELEKRFTRSKFFPERPRVSSSTFWHSLGFKICDRLDINKTDREKDDICHDFLQMDLNYPLEDQITEHKKYDLVTDFGNNEHPFDVAEAYKTMHKLCKKSGLMFIHQNIYGGNGFYNFDVSVFESIAAVNNYSILYSAYTVDIKNKYFSLPIDKDLLNTIDFSKIGELGVFYLFKKNEDNNFIVPYQDSGKNLENKEYFSNVINKDNLMPSRTYLPMSSEKLSGKMLLKFLLKKIKNKIIK